MSGSEESMTERDGRFVKTINFWDWDKNDHAQVNIILFLLKFFAAFIIIFVIYQMVTLKIEEAWEDSKFYSKEQRLEYCDRYYYDRDFEGLYDDLCLYDLYDEEFDVYWEAVDGYWDYLQYTMWKGAYEQGQLTGAEEKMQSFQDKVCQNANQCEFEKNQRLLNGYKDLVFAE